MRYQGSSIPVVVLALLCGSALAGSTLNFPRASFDTNTFTGVAFVNPNNVVARLEISLISTDGSDALPSTTLDIPPGAQQALLLTDIFKNPLPPDRVCWMRVTSEQDGITGFFLFLNNTVSQFDGADLPQISHRILFNEVRHGGGFSTEINLINPSSDWTNVKLILFRPGLEPATADLPAGISRRGVVRFDPAAIFKTTQIPAGSYLSASANVGIGGFALIKSGKDLLGLNAQPATTGQQILYFPQMAVLGPWKTELGIVNYSTEAAILTISAFKGNGTPHSGDYLKGTNPVTRQLPAEGALMLDVAELFGFQTTASQTGTLDGWIRVESTNSGISGFVSYGVVTAGSLAAVPSQSIALNRAFFSHLATDLGYFTGLALLNPGQLTNNYRVVVLRKDGTVIGSTDGVLRPGERVSRLITEFVPQTGKQSGGFIWVSSTQAMYMTSLFGTAKGFNPSLKSEILANIAPQAATPFYQPNASPPLQIQPSLAVLQPNATKQFSVSGAIRPVVWKVNGSTTASVAGSISTSGLYQAPSQVPTGLPVVISAEATDRPNSSGASVDVLRRTQLAKGEGTVQSVTFLRSQQKLFSAELLSSGASGADSSQPQGSGNSQIRAVLPAPALLLKSLPGEDVSKMIGYSASNGPEYLLVSTSGGRVVRLDPTLSNPPLVEIASGLTNPTSMVLDPVSGNLLVVAGSSIVTVAKSAIEKGLVTTLQSDSGPRDDRPKFFIGDLDNPQGIAVDACTGNIIVSQNSGLYVIDRVSGSRYFLGESGFPGEVLGLYRKEMPCPSAFQVIVANPAQRKIQLYDPNLGTGTPWVTSAAFSTNDLAYLPKDNTITAEGSTGILLGDRQSDGAASDIYVVNVPNLYVDKQANTLPKPTLDNVSDPRGDTFGTLEPQIDLLEVNSAFGDGGWIISLTFDSPVTPLWQGLPNGLAGVIGIDTDQDASTGAGVWPGLGDQINADIGMDYVIWLRQETDGGGALILKYYGSGEYGPTGYEGSISFGPDGSTVLFFIPYSSFDPDGLMNFIVVAGTDAEPTDVAPNLGFLTTGAEYLPPHY